MRQRGQRSRTKLSALGLVGWALGIVLMGVPSPAQAETALHEIKWNHQSPDSVVRFVVFVSPVRGDRSKARQINVGKPANPVVDATGLVYSAIISADLDHYAAVGAISLDGSLSPLSEWFEMPPSPPGRPFYIP